MHHPLSPQADLATPPESSVKQRILLVDDHQIFREALRGLLERMPGLEIVGDVGDAADIVTIARASAADIVCMDIGLPGANGIVATQQLLAACPGIKVIALSTYTDQIYVLDMLKAGALGYVTKSEGGKALLQAIESVALNQQYLSPGVTDLLTDALSIGKGSKDAAVLGPRERQVLCLVAQGLSSQHIGTQLDIAVSTVDVHRRNIMRKLDLHSAVDLTRYAIKAGLLPD